MNEKKDLYQLILESLNYREIYILSQKFVYKKTLQEIGNFLNITRERVRQIIKKTLSKLCKFIFITDEGQNIIDFINFFIIFDEKMINNKVSEIYLNFNKSDIDFMTYILIYSLLNENLLKIHKINKNVYFYYLSNNNEKVELIMKKIMNDNYLENIDEFKKNLINYLIELNKSKIIYNFNNYISNFLDLALNIYNLYNKKTIDDLIYFILKKNYKPMHYTEIALEIENIIKKPIQERYIHNILIKDEKYCWAGNGYYALNEWGYKKENTEIIDIIISMIKEYNRGITIDEIYDYILSRYKVDKNSVYMALKNYEGIKVKKIGKKLWTLI